MITFCPLGVRCAFVYFRFVRSDLLLMVVVMCVLLVGRGMLAVANIIAYNNIVQYPLPVLCCDDLCCNQKKQRNALFLLL